MTKIILFLSLLICIPAAAMEPKIDQLTLIVGFKPGGTSTVAARQIASAINEKSGTDVIVMSREGAGGLLAANAVLEQNNSHVLLFFSSTSALRVRPDMGLVPVGLIATFPYVVVANKNAPSTLDAYFQAARHEDKLRSYTSPGTGTFPHLAGERLFREHGIKGVHVPFTGSSPAAQSVYAGHVQLGIVPYIDYAPLKDGLREFPGAGEKLGIDGWIGIYAPPSTTQAEISRYVQMFKSATEASTEKLALSGFKAHWEAGTQLQKLHEQSYKEWKPELDRLGIKFE